MVCGTRKIYYNWREFITKGAEQRIAIVDTARCIEKVEYIPCHTVSNCERDPATGEVYCRDVYVCADGAMFSA